MPTVTINGRSMHYLDEGKGFPILFGHSFLWDANMWQPQVQAFKTKFRCIVPELFSHGRSAPLESSAPYSIEQMVRDHVQLLDHLGIEQCIVVGLSVGGMWGARLALDHPERVAGLVLCGTYVGAEPEETHHAYGQLIDGIEQMGGFSDPVLDGMIPLFFAPQTFTTNPALPAVFREQLVTMNPEMLPGICGIGRGIFARLCLLGELAKITQSTLVMVGESDIPRPVPEAQEMARLLPQGELCRISDGGHICNLENIDDFNGALERFFQTIELPVPQCEPAF